MAWFRRGSLVCAHNGLGSGSVTCAMWHRWFSCVCDRVQRWFRSMRCNGSIACVFTGGLIMVSLVVRMSVCGMVYIWVRCVWSSVVVQLIVAWFICGSVVVQLWFACMSEFNIIGSDMC